MNFLLRALRAPDLGITCQCVYALGYSPVFGNRIRASLLQLPCLSASGGLFDPSIGPGQVVRYLSTGFDNLGANGLTRSVCAPAICFDIACMERDTE